MITHFRSPIATSEFWAAAPEPGNSIWKNLHRRGQKE
jgi:hypothetical protein